MPSALTCSLCDHGSETQCLQGGVTIRLGQLLGREGSLTFQAQTKQKQDDALMHKPQAQLSAQLRNQLFGHSPLPSVLGLLPHIFLTFTHPVDSSAQRFWVAKRSPTQERSLTVHLRCERTLPGHALGVMSRTSYCRASFTEVLQHLTARPHAQLWAQT